MQTCRQQVFSSASLVSSVVESSIGQRSQHREPLQHRFDLLDILPIKNRRRGSDELLEILSGRRAISHVEERYPEIEQRVVLPRVDVNGALPRVDAGARVS